MISKKYLVLILASQASHIDNNYVPSSDMFLLVICSF